MLAGSVRWRHGIQFKERMAVQKEALGSGDTSHQWNNRHRGGRQRCNQLKLEWVRSSTVSVANPALVWRVACDDSLCLFPSSHSHPHSFVEEGPAVGSVPHLTPTEAQVGIQPQRSGPSHSPAHPEERDPTTPFLHWKSVGLWLALPDCSMAIQRKQRAGTGCPVHCGDAILGVVVHTQWGKGGK